MLKTKVSVLVISLLMLPQFVLAAWWNPFSWSFWDFFKKAPVVQQSVELPIEKIPEVPAHSTSTQNAAFEIDILRKEVESLNKKLISKVATPEPAKVSSQSTPATTSIASQSPKIVTLPNGAIYEVDEKGNVGRLLQAAPVVQEIPATGAQSIPISNTSSVAEINISQISSTPSLQGAQFSWRTNIPTTSKIFVVGGGVTKVVISNSGLSTYHVASVVDLPAGTSYSYEIEAISGDNSVSKSYGQFSTIDKSDLLVTKIAGPTTPDPLNNVPYGEYIYKVSVLGKAGEYLRDAPVYMEAPSDNVYWGKEIELSKKTNGMTNSQLNDWNTSFSYVPTTTGSKTIKFISGNLSKVITFDVQ